jgi:hydrogenase maturation protein HypF
MKNRLRIEVTGIVQGVGFRPFIYQLAKRNALVGYVCNTSDGVIIEAEGDERGLKDFLNGVAQEAPPLALITGVTSEPIPSGADVDFVILESSREAERKALISPDVCTCAACLRELFDPTDRRYRYPFINCTNCGPRYTLTTDVPYDRANTTMASFTMCEACRREYEDPMDRRFHAQPNACWECGPRVFLTDAAGERLEHDDPVNAAIGLLRDGIVAIKGLGGFHLAVDAANDDAVKMLRGRKLREEKPFAIMAQNVRTVEEFCTVSVEERELLESPNRPIVLLRKTPDNPISDRVAPRNKYLGVMLPYTPLHHLLLGDTFLALVMTSANPSDEPIVIDNAEALERLAGLADYFLMHDRDIFVQNDDSVTRIVNKVPVMVRRSRGYAPRPIFFKKPVGNVLACGPELKNTVCLLKGKHAFLSQHIGDLKTAETFAVFKKTIDHLKRIFEIHPQIVAYDLHPDYLSTRYALELRDNDRDRACFVGVQHHHAHIVSCTAECGIEGSVIGLALDGTGYGDDGCIWGGEILVADEVAYRRAGHFEYVPMPGGDAVIKEPWRMALSYLYHTYGSELWRLEIDFVRGLDRQKAAILLRMIDSGVNSVPTSSCGRLFDAVSALIGVRSSITYEGQAACELEGIMADEDAGSYQYAVSAAKSREGLGETGPAFVISFAGTVRGIVHDVQQGVDPPTISRKFHRTVADALKEACVRVRESYGLNRVAMSGGVFQNVYLLETLSAELGELGFEVYQHSAVPNNDGCISLGQAVIAAHRVADEGPVSERVPRATVCAERS